MNKDSWVKKEVYGWGCYPRVIRDVYYPPLAKLDLTDRSSIGQLTPRGNARSYGDASLPVESGLGVEMTTRNLFESFDSETGILVADSGVILEDILSTFVPKGWTLPVSPGTRFVSLGGAVAANVHGKNHHVVGSIENFIDKIWVLTEGGVKVASPTENIDLFGATIGGYGFTGLILKIAIKLKPVQSSWIKVKLVRAANIYELIALCKQYDPFYEYAVSWMDTLSTGKKEGRGWVMLGKDAELNELSPAMRQNPLKIKWQNPLSLFVPSFFLKPFFMKWFNTLYYNRSLTSQFDGYNNMEQWFYPLDKIKRWNHFYGKSGFIQYQFVIPDGSVGSGMKAVLKKLKHFRLGSFLSVFKRVASDNVVLPFSIPGYTLALDIPFEGQKTLSALNEVDSVVSSYGGRVYLAKDARLDAKMFRKMYPTLDNFIEIVDKYNPNRFFYSEMGKRLKI